MFSRTWPIALGLIALLVVAGRPNTPMIDGWAAWLSSNLSLRAGVEWRKLAPP